MTPCYDPGYQSSNSSQDYSHSSREQENTISSLRKELRELKDKNNWLEAGLCALISELQNRGNAGEIIAQASRHGLIDLMDFWVKHSNEDESRLAKKFHEFSKHEQAMLKKMMEDGKI